LVAGDIDALLSAEKIQQQADPLAAGGARKHPFQAGQEAAGDDDPAAVPELQGAGADDAVSVVLDGYQVIDENLGHGDVPAVEAGQAGGAAGGADGGDVVRVQIQVGEDIAGE